MTNIFLLLKLVVNKIFYCSIICYFSLSILVSVTSPFMQGVGNRKKNDTSIIKDLRKKILLLFFLMIFLSGLN